MDCSTPGSSIHGICQARVLEWGAIAISMCPIVLYNFIMWTCLCIYHYSQDIEHFSQHLKFPFCFLGVKPLPRHLLITGLILTIQEFCINLVVQLVTFLVSLLSFSLMLLRLNHVIACICSLILLLSSVLLYGYATICLSIL